MARILLIDVEQMHREFVATALSRKGHAVTTTGSAMPVVRDADGSDFGTDFDVVITDLVTPDVEGGELVRALRAAHPRSRIIAISGAGPQDRSRAHLTLARHLGAQSTLAKPFTITDLYGAVEKAMAVA